MPAPDEINSLRIREITPEDAQTAAQLCEELGYPVSAQRMRNRIGELRRLPDHVIYVICAGDAVIGWIDVGIVQHLQTEQYGEIGGFVISNAYRSRGIGRKLLTYAERWISAKGITRVVVRSRITRESAHRFYLREGYLQTKTSAVFSKDLSALDANGPAK